MAANPTLLTAHSSKDKQKQLQTLLNKHPLHSKTQYLSFDRVQTGTQTDESELPNVTKLMDSLHALRQDFERTKLALKAQYEHQIDERVNIIWTQLHQRLNAQDEEHQRSMEHMRKSYSVRYANAIAKLTSEFHRQRDALLVHARRLYNTERQSMMDELNHLRDWKSEHEAESKRMRLLINKQAILLKKYECPADEIAELHQFEEEWTQMQDTLRSKNEEIRRLNTKISTLEENGGAALAATASSSARGSVNIRRRPSVSFTPAIMVVGASTTDLNQQQTRPTTANTAAFAMNSNAPVVKVEGFSIPEPTIQPAASSFNLAGGGQPQLRRRGSFMATSRFALVDGGSNTNGTMPDVTINVDNSEEREAAIKAAREEQARLDKAEAEAMLQKAMEEMEASFNEKMEEMEEDHEGELMQLKLELTRVNRQFQKQLATAKESAQTVSNPAGLEMILQRQENVLKFAKLFFGTTPLEKLKPIKPVVAAAPTPASVAPPEKATEGEEKPKAETGSQPIA